LRLQKYPFVVLGKLDGLSADIVTIDEVGISYKIGRHLLELGHRSIGFVGYDTENRPVRERYEGVRKALAESGVELNPAHVIENSEGWVDRTVAMLRRPDRPTALVIISDVNTLMALARYRKETGLRIR
jgi:LacI family transcriptional regulator